MIYKQPVTETQRRTALQNQANETALANLNTAIRNETTNRQNADSEINQNLSAMRAILNEEIAERSSDVAILRADLQTETSNRQAGDSNLQAALDLEIENRNRAESNLRNEINSAVDNEKTNRAQAISDLKSELEDDIDNEKNLRIAADNSLRDNLASETALRTAAINSVLNSLAAESTNRSAEDSRLAGLIATETTNRNNAINTAKGELQNQLNTQSATIATLATKTYVDGQIAGVQENLSVFTAPTATADGKQGQVPAPKKTSKMEILTNYGWRPADDTTLAINTLPSQSAPLTFNTGTLTPSWANFDAGKLSLSRGTTSGSSATSYTVYFKPIDIYLWSDTLDQQEKPVTWTINKRPIIKPLESQREFDFGQTYDFSQFISNFDATYMNRPNNMSANTVGVHTYDITLKYPNDTYWGNNVNDTAKVTLSFEIKQRFLSAELSTGFAQAAPATFNGQNQTISITNTNSAYHTVTGNVQSNAGTFTAYVAPASGYEWDGGGTTPKPVTITIDKKAINQPKVTSDISFGYDGNAHSITVTGYDPSTMIESGDAKTQTAVGDYVLKYNLRDANNYVWAETNDASEYRIDWNIGIKRLAYPSYDNTNPFVYSGEYKDLVVSGYDSDYMTSEGTVHEINAGTYTIKYHLTHTDRATWTGGATADYTLTWEIQRKPLTAAQSSGFSQSGTLTFNGENQSPQINKFDATIHKVTGNLQSDAGTFTATVSPLDNYCWSDKTYAAKNVSWTIGALQIVINQTFIGDTTNANKLIAILPDKTFNGNAQIAIDANKIYYYGNKTCTIAVNDAFNVTGTQKSTNAGDYSFTLTLKYPNNIQWYFTSYSDYDVQRQLTSYSAYVDKPIQFNWKIARQKLNAVTFSQNGTLTFNGQNQTAEFNNFNDTYHTVTDDVQSDAGTYTAYISPVTNYAWNDGSTDPEPVSWTIGKKIVPVPRAAQTEFPYDGTKKTLDFGDTYVTTDMTFLTTGGSASEGTVAKSYVAIFRLNDANNSRWSTGGSDNYSIEWSIGMTKVAIPVPNKVNFDYEPGVLRTPTFTIEDSSAINDPTGDVNATNAQDTPYVITFSLADSNTTVWEDGTTAPKSFNWRINRKKLSATQSTFAQTATIPFDGDTHDANISNYDPDYHSIGGEYANKSDAKTYTAIITPRSNYCWNDGTYAEKPVNWQITQIKIAKPTLTGEVDTLYNTQTHFPTENNYVEKYMTRTGTLTPQSAVGEYKITYKLKSVNNTIWSDDTTETVTLNWSIYKISVEKPTAKKTEFAYWYANNAASAQTFNGSNIVGYDETVMLESGDTSGTDAGNYQLKYTLLNKVGYTWDDGTTADVTINFTMLRRSINYPLGTTMNGRIESVAQTYTGAQINSLSISGLNNGLGNSAYYYWRVRTASYNDGLQISAVTITGETTASEAGIHNVTIAPTANYCWDDTGTQEGRPYTWEIRRARITAPTVDSSVTLTYNENSQSPTLLNFDADKMEIVSGDSATNAGDYQIGIRPKGNWCWAADDTRDIAAGSTDIIYLDWSIERQPLSEGLSTLFFYPNALKWENAAQYVDKGLYTTRSPSTRYIHDRIYAYDEDSAYQSSTGVFCCNIRRDPISKFYKLEGQQEVTQKVGQYTTWIYPSDNYCWSDGSIAPKIQKWYRPPTTVTVPTFSGTRKFDFDGAEHTVTINKASDVTVTATTPITEVSSTRITTSATAAGTYTLTFHCPEGKIWLGTHSYDNPAGDNSDYVLTWTIGETNITAVDKPYLAEDAKTSFEYESGTEYHLDVQGFDSDTMTSNNYFDASNAGTYTLVITPKNNVVWTGGGTGQVSFTWEITRKPLTKTQSNLYQTNTKTFQHETNSIVGKEQTVTLANFNALYHEVVSGDKATNADDYTVVVKVKDNYCWADGSTANKPIPWKIKPASVPCPVADSTALEYTGSPQFPSLTYVAEGINTTTQPNSYNYAVTITNGDKKTNVENDITTTYTLKDDSNWQWSDKTTAPKTITWKITPKFLTIPTATSATTFTYNGNEQGLTISGFAPATMDSDGTIAETNAGDYSVSYNLKDTQNYRWNNNTTEGTAATQTISWKIKRASCYLPGLYNRVYNGKEQTVIYGTPATMTTYGYWVGAEFVYSFVNKGLIFRGVLKETNAGTYTYYIRPDENHYWHGTTYGSNESTAEREYTWTIEKAPCEITLPVDSFTLTDDDHPGYSDVVFRKIEDCAPSSPSDGEFSFSPSAANSPTVAIRKNYSVISGLTLLGRKNGTYTITVRQAETDNYLAPPDKTITVKVERTIQSMIWAYIKQHTTDGTLLDYTHIGDTKTVTLNGTVGNLTLNGTYRAVLIGFDHNLPTEADGASHTAHFAIMKSATTDNFIAFCSSDYGSTSTDYNSFIHSPDFSDIGWGASNLRTGIGEDFNSLLTSTLGNYWIDGLKKGYGSESLCADEIWTFSATELALNATEKIGAAYDYFADGNNPTFYRHDNENQAVEIWTRQGARNDLANGKMYTYTTNSSNRLGSATINKSLGFVPCFIIG